MGAPALHTSHNAYSQRARQRLSGLSGSPLRLTGVGPSAPWVGLNGLGGRNALWDTPGRAPGVGGATSTTSSSGSALSGIRMYRIASYCLVYDVMSTSQGQWERAVGVNVGSLCRTSHAKRLPCFNNGARSNVERIASVLPLRIASVLPPKTLQCNGFGKPVYGF